MSQPDSAEARRRAGLEAWCAFFTRFPEVAPEGADALVSDDVRFVDPFNDLRGKAALRALVAHTLKTVREPRFTVTHKALDGDLGLIRWTFEGRIPVLGHWAITGMSEVHLNDQGQVTAHIDHWDASQHFHGRLPGLGLLIRRLNKAAGVRQPAR
ncbi:nuclear transport factor 2 family protein [Roseospirillum parvum]|uniref:SnoaL-like domain-containing protein n=1 Tax=Roseospirillum parvum TaxID=83401 RepID=A0A1G7XX04_9PROT|nr:nuclear transport factor 2 family protein [Roseospirillum parvum]SDG88718.1 SnoaL-like domain-containing protein [Roseospirillum parvum]